MALRTLEEIEDVNSIATASIGTQSEARSEQVFNLIRHNNLTALRFAKRLVEELLAMRRHPIPDPSVTYAVMRVRRDP